MEKYQSLEPNTAINYVRNSNFHTGTLAYWSMNSSLNTYNVVPCSDCNGGYKLEINGLGGTLELEHVYYSYVKDSHNIYVEVTDELIDAYVYKLDITCYSSNLDIIDGVVTDWFHGNTVKNVTTHRIKIPYDTSFIKLKLVTKNLSGSYVLYSVNITQDKTDKVLPLHKETVRIDGSYLMNCPPSSSEYITLHVPEDIQYRILSFNYDLAAPTGATTGLHYISFLYDSVTYSARDRLLRIQNNYNAAHTMLFNDPTYSTTAVIRPASIEAFTRILRTTKFDGTHPFNLFYNNNTDRKQNNRFYYSMLLEILELE